MLKFSRKKGVVFTLDALFALLIALAIIPLVLLISSQPSQEIINRRLFLQAEDAISVLSTVNVADVIREPVMASLYESGVINDANANQSLLEFVNTLWASNSSENITYARNITENIFRSVFPPNIQWSLVIENDTVYQTSPDFKKAVTLSQRVSSGFKKGAPSTGYTSSVFLTRIGGKNAYSYYFFGGFVGEGNVSAQISDIPGDAQVKSVYLELNGGANFTLLINSTYCSTMNVTAGNFTVNNWTINSSSCVGLVAPGAQNNFSINFVTNNLTKAYIGGGFLRVTYSTADLVSNDNGTYYYHFPGIDGLINLYDSFYVPGNITYMSANITLFTPANYTTVLNVGNTTVINYTGNGSLVTLNVSNATFQQLMSSNNITFVHVSSSTIPIRMFVTANITGGLLNGTTDVVLITDVSGSMAWRIDQDNVNGATVNNCNNPNIYANNVSRISLAKCLDKSFVSAILGGNSSACGAGTPAVGNRVSLVSFSASANNWENLTANITYLSNRIDAYATGGFTCISCALNRAYDILTSQSGPDRSKYIVLMTDGVANYRSTPVCYDFNDVSLNVTAGSSGATAKRTPEWLAANTNGAIDNFNAVSMINDTFGRAGASGGSIYSWNGTAWALDADTGNNDILGIKLFNSTLGFAVGESGKIWKWNGFTWSEVNDFGSFSINDVAIINSTLGFAAADGGRIYSWNGASWSLYQDIGGTNLFGVSGISVNSTFAVGASGGIYRWNGTAWPLSQDTGGSTHNRVSVLNSTSAFTASSDGRVYQWNGAAWTNVLLSLYPLNSVYAYNDTLAYAMGDSRGDIYSWNGTAWSRTYSVFYYQGTSSSGIDCGDDDTCSLNVDQSYSALNANYSALQAFNIGNTTIDAVGVGPVSTCNIGNQTLKEVARTGNGTAYSSSNASQLQSIYCQIAQNIITKPTITQQVVAQGTVQSTLLPNSFIQFDYIPGTPPAGYQEISISAETDPFAGCDGKLILPPGIKVVDTLRTSYSGFYWTKYLFINNTGNAFRNVYNLSTFGKDYTVLGDPYKVYIPTSLVVVNDTNVVRNELGLNTSFLNTTCSNYDRIIYTIRLRASVPFGAVFPQLSGGVVRIYYDIDHDGLQDGFTDVTVGSTLPNFNPSVRTVDQLDPANNAVDDAIIRLMDTLNFVSGFGRSGSASNPIDIRLSDVEISTTGTAGVPYAWGPINARFEVRI